MSRDAQGEAGSRDDGKAVKVSNHERISNASFSIFRSTTMGRVSLKVLPPWFFAMHHVDIVNERARLPGQIHRAADGAE